MEKEQATRVLVVDDDASVRTTLARFLTESGYEVLSAADGEEGMELLRKERPAVVLLDIEMPRMNGLEVLRRIMAEQIDVGVLMISGYPDEAAAKKAMELGASDFISKPFDYSYLETSLMVKLATLDV